MVKSGQAQRPSVNNNITNPGSQSPSTFITAPAATSPSRSPKSPQSPLSGSSPEIGACEIPTPTTSSKKSPVSSYSPPFTPPHRRQQLASLALQKNSTSTDVIDSSSRLPVFIYTSRANGSQSTVYDSNASVSSTGVCDTGALHQDDSVDLATSTATLDKKRSTKYSSASPRSRSCTTSLSVRAGLRNSPVLTASPATPGRATSPNNSRFAFLSKMSPFHVFGQTPQSTPKEDELSSLDIEAALCPEGAHQEGDAISPSAYENLQVSATGLARKLQSAYKARTLQVHELQADNETLEEEKLQLDTRTQHLKLQLEEMARKAAETESIMQELMVELSKEKRLRAEDRHAHRSRAAPSIISTVSEDLGAEDDQQRKRWRGSAIDNSSDDEHDSVTTASVFSRSRSPTIRSSNVSVLEASPVDIAPLPDYAKHSQMSAFQKLMKGFSEATLGDTQATHGCSNCHGQSASMAWDTASVMRDENRGLKNRVTELESALEGALDIVNKVGI